MKIKAYLKFAGTLIFPKAEKKSSARASLFGAITCIGLSIVPLIVVISIANGMINGMTERMIGLSTGHIQAYVAAAIDETSSSEKFKEYAKRYTEKYSDILSAYPEISITGLASGKTIRTGAQIRAVSTEVFKTNKSFTNLFEIVEGDLNEFVNAEENGKVAVIGKKLSETLELKPGDTFKIITTKTLNGIVAPKLTTFTVSAIVSSGYQELDALWVFIPIDTAFKNLSLTNANFTIMMNTNDAFSSEISRTQRILQNDNGRYANFYRWNQVHEAEYQNFASTKVMLIFIMILIVIVASVNVSSAIVMLVMERQKEIAILKSIGAKPSGITLSFLIAGGSCGVAGVLAGVPVGILLSIFSPSIINGLEWIINKCYQFVLMIQGQEINSGNVLKLLDPDYYIQNFTVDIDINNILIVSVLTILLSVFVSIIPALKAGKEKPLDIMRKS